jgi:hypothetical protein
VVVTARSLDLVIGFLSLEDLGPGARPACADAFAAEFERLARARGFPTPAAGGATEWRLPPVSIAVAPGDSDARLGRALARGLFDALVKAAVAP